MEHQSLDLGKESFLCINGALVFFSLVANIFYACCLIFPLHSKRRLKQPLKTLLECLVWCSVLYCVSLPILYFLPPDTSQMLSWLFLLFFTYCSMICSSWLNFFYYMQIVPQKRAVSIWLKKNIKPFIYVALVFDVMFVLLDTIMNIVFTTTDFTYINGTEDAFHGLSSSNLVAIVISKVHILVCLCVTTASSFCTVRYLSRHIRNMSFNTPRIKSHKRVTFAGISQGVLYFFYGVFYFIDTFTLVFSPDFYFPQRVYFTVTSVYMFGTTVNLGIGQALFRKRAADVWMALKTMGVVAILTNDMKLQSSQMTSDGIVTVTGQMTL